MAERKVQHERYMCASCSPWHSPAYYYNRYIQLFSFTHADGNTILLQCSLSFALSSFNVFAKCLSKCKILTSVLTESYFERLMLDLHLVCNLKSFKHFCGQEQRMWCYLSPAVVLPQSQDLTSWKSFEGFNKLLQILKPVPPL